VGDLGGTDGSNSHATPTFWECQPIRSIRSVVPFLGEDLFHPFGTCLTQISERASLETLHWLS
jgi:hypothetical protein